MRSWLDIFDAHMTDVTGCTIKAASDALRESARIFCERTKVLRQDLEPMMTVPGQTVYDFDVSSEVEIVKLFAAQLDGVPIPLQAEARPGERCVQVLSPVQFGLYPAVSTAQPLKFNAAVEPSPTASAIEDWVADKYARILVLGAKAILLSSSGKPYSDEAKALQLRAEFDAEIADVKGQVAQAFSNAPLRVKAHFV